MNLIEEANQFKKRLTIALKAAKICVFEVDLVQQLYTFFENAEDIFGISGDVILKEVQPYSKLSPEEYQVAVSNYFSHPEDAPVIAEAFRRILNGQATTYEARMKAGGSAFVWCKIDVTPIVEHNQSIKMIGVITDITYIKERTDLLKEKVKLDTFTGLYNKDYAIKTMRSILNHAPAQPCALVLLDIDNFKQFNDEYGHYEGDKVIKKTSRLLRDTFRQSDVVGRFGGDEFIVLIRNFADSRWLAERLAHIVQCQNDSLSSTNSIGVAVYPQDGTEFEELFQKADQALYYSKKIKKSYTFFSDIQTP